MKSLASYSGGVRSQRELNHRPFADNEKCYQYTIGTGCIKSLASYSGGNISNVIFKHVGTPR